MTYSSFPGSIFAQTAEGTNALLRDGARLVRDGADILEDLGLGGIPVATQSQMVLGETNDGYMTPWARRLATSMSLAEKAGLSAGAASASCSHGAEGLVRNHGAQYYVLR